jgi:hypothetical protein
MKNERKEKVNKEIPIEDEMETDDKIKFSFI